MLEPKWEARKLPRQLVVLGDWRAWIKRISRIPKAKNMRETTHYRPRLTRGQHARVGSARVYLMRGFPLTAPPTLRVSAVTGEEDEEVKAEVKGTKVFIKRGTSDFGNGILGHVKLLSHRETAEQRLGQYRPPTNL